MKPKQIPGVSLQKGGGFHDSESTKEYPASEIDVKFHILRDRFFSINEWKSYCKKASAEFKHYDHTGQPANRHPEKGDFIRIGIPGPGSKEASGYDWVEIVYLSHRDTEGSESYLMICRPSKEPNKLKGHIAHFYSSAATSNIMISKEGNILKVGVYGRNERPNFNAGFIDKIRNFLIAFGGMFGVSKIQWKLLAEGLLDFK
ncbi:hypothetical protein MKJ01_06585 [Chryseobacterium sp. SSA4.19]|uniref:hypothetical protein n=1 Tax=Chryseobacterium sp. SSA4.19 TaxID=2919915 RepID=UPI001F4D6BBF|nr:hypothetical protein [Chryseobacterium sp. SSA4.19]MCJ8153429.1 hypothetical protein [Chryseobacterium sp. SSA4.19]